MEIPHLKEKQRKKVIDAMSKKLATPGEPAIIIKRRKRYIWMFVTVVICTTLSLIYFIVANYTPVFEQKSTLSANSPFLLIKTAYQSNTLTEDEYAVLLCKLMVKYDSLPDNYKVPHPYIDVNEVYTAIRRLWPITMQSTREYLLLEFPSLEDKLFQTSDSSLAG